jgi:hypothetical protein
MGGQEVSPKQRYNWWVTVNVDDGPGTTGDVLVECSQCDYYMEVKAELRNSVFWDMHIGTAVLVVMGHFEKEHQE